MAAAAAVCVAVCLCLSLAGAHNTDLEADRVTFTFPEFQYKETSKNELTFREYESACDQSESCQKLADISRIQCIRQCVSPSCFHELYAHDLLEEGEVDVRLNSFKGCFVQRHTRPRA